MAAEAAAALSMVVSPIFCPSCEAYPGPTVAQADGTFEAIGLEVDARAELLGPFAGRHVLRW